MYTLIAETRGVIMKYVPSVVVGKQNIHQKLKWTIYITDGEIFLHVTQSI